MLPYFMRDKLVDKSTEFANVAKTKLRSTDIIEINDIYLVFYLLHNRISKTVVSTITSVKSAVKTRS